MSRMTEAGGTGTSGCRAPRSLHRSQPLPPPPGRLALPCRRTRPAAGRPVARFLDRARPTRARDRDRAPKGGRGVGVAGRPGRAAGGVRPALAVALSAFCAIAWPAPGAQADPPAGVIAVIDRTTIEMSGLATLSQLLSQRAAVNVFGIQGLSSAIGGSYLVDGRRTSGLDFSTFPLSAVERIELLEEGATRFSGHIGDGTINIVRRRGHEGSEISGGIGRPVQPGADSSGGSALWGGRLGRGQLLVGVDHVFSEEVREANRDYTRTKFTDSLAGAQGVSISGNTLFVGNDRYALGDCEPPVYTGPQKSGSGEACGYAYADVAWIADYPRTKRDSLFLHADVPLPEGRELYLDSLVSQTTTRFVWAPPPELFTFDLPGDSPVRPALEAAIPGLEVPAGGSVTVAHRFVGHGNRDWRWDWDRRDLALGLRGEIAAGVTYDAQVRYYRSHGIEEGGTFVSGPLVRAAVLGGEYDIVNPLSTDPVHREAVRQSAVRSTRDSRTETAALRAALDGAAWALPAGPVRWTAAVEFVDYAYTDVEVYRDFAGHSYDLSEVLGERGSNVVAERRSAAVQAAAVLPLRPGWELVLTGQRNDYDDVGALTGWRVASQYRPNETVALRVTSDNGEFSPGVRQLYESGSTSSPYVRDCKAYPGDPDACLAAVAVNQVENERVGNPDLEPSEARTVGFGATFRFGKLSLAADWYRTEIWNRPSRPSAQSLVDLENRGEPLPEGAAVIRVDGSETGKIVRLVTPLFNRRDNESWAEGIAVRAGASWPREWGALSLDVNVLRSLGSETWVAGVRQPGDYPRYGAHAALRAIRGDLAASWNVRAVSGYWNATRTGRWGGWLGHDLALQWRQAFGLDGLQLTGGFINVGDREPALNPANPNNPALSYDAVRGRTFFLNASMAW